MRHLTTECLRALLADEPAAWAAYWASAQDPSSFLCPECEALLSGLLERRAASADDCWMDRAVAHAIEATALEPAAVALARELLAVGTHAERLALIRRHPGRFGNPFLVTRLVATAQAALRTDPRQTARLAELAVAVARELPRSLGEVVPLELELEARAVEANALRAAGDFAAADRRLTQVLGQLPEIADPLLELDVLSYAVSLRKVQHRFGEAEVFVEQALELADELEDTEQRARLLIQKSDLQYYNYQLPVAAATLEEALQILEDGPNQLLLRCAHHNLVVYLAEGGLPRQAREYLAKHRGFFRDLEGLDTYGNLRRRWIEGVIAEGLGEVQAAEGAYRLCQQAFLSKGLLDDAASTTLDLAALLVSTGRLEEVGELATAALTTFQAIGIERNALAALVLLQRAAACGSVSAAAIRKWAGQLRRGDLAGSLARRN
jgi:tetratricopeptide (TPR) repeat protein